MTPRRTFVWLCAGVAAMAGVLRAQSPNPPQPATVPQFRSGVALLRIDASVLDDSARAIGDLTPADFQVTIDGQPRRVAFAQFTGATKATAVAPAGGVATHVVNDSFPQGRAIAVVVDLASIRAGNEAPLLDTAAQLMEKLRPSDAVGLVPLPGPTVDLTRDRGRVAQALRALRGTSDMPMFRHTFTFDEAVGYARDDKITIEKVIERECARDTEARHQERLTGSARRPPDEPGTLGLKPLNPDAPTVVAACPTDLKGETIQRIQYERSHIQTLLSNLVTVAANLRAVHAPTTIVLISGGLAFDQESYAVFEQAQRAIRDAGLGFYAVQVDQPQTQASDKLASNAAFYSSSDRASGLSSLATMSGGVFFPGVGKAKGVFERLRTELTEAYELGVEAEPGDLDGKPHEVRVLTTRKAVMHSRSTITSPLPPSDAPARLANLIAQPVDVGDLPIALSAHSVRGDEATTLKVMIRADVGHGATTAPARYAAVVIDSRGAVVTNVTGTTASDGSLLLTTQLAPGSYRLRMAALDAGGRTGTLEAPIVAGLRAAGGMQLGDLIVGTLANQALTPSIYAVAGQPILPTLELTSADSTRFAQTAIGFEVRRAGSDDVVATAAAKLQETAYERQQIARGSVPTTALQPGEYVLSAVIKVDGQPAGRVSRTFVLEPASERAAPVAAAAAVPPKPADAPAPAVIADATLNDVMHKAAGYVASYGEQMSAVVGIEKYVQNVNPLNGPALRPRQIVAEFALVKSGGPVPWTGYRDVVEVNGDPISDRRDRIVKILTESPNPLEEAARLTAESARFNVGPVSRNFNVPTSALFFFHESNLARFAFTRKGTKKIDGTDTMEIAFKEMARPTLITTRAGKDVPAEGTIWILPSNGTVVRTRLQLKGFSDLMGTGGVSAPSASASAPSGLTGSSAASGRGGGRGSVGDTKSTTSGGSSIGGFPDLSPTELQSTADIEVTYRRDEKIGMWLPAQMTEEYQGQIPQINRAAIAALARSKATYSDYKQFGTSATVIGIKK